MPGFQDDIVGLYLDPPKKRRGPGHRREIGHSSFGTAQGWIRLPNGKALIGFNHEYKRHGTSTLFAALDIANWANQGWALLPPARREFLDFMNRVVAEHPEQ